MAHNHRAQISTLKYFAPQFSILTHNQDPLDKLILNIYQLKASFQFFLTFAITSFLELSLIIITFIISTLNWVPSSSLDMATQAEVSALCRTIGDAWYKEEVGGRGFDLPDLTDRDDAGERAVFDIKSRTTRLSGDIGANWYHDTSTLTIDDRKFHLSFRVLQRADHE